MTDASTAQWLISAAISASGVSCALGYLLRERRRTAGGAARRNALLAAPRPWRRLGAAIVALLAVMFFLGVNLITPAHSPRAFALFWLIMLLLVLWLCAIAWVDIRHTRRLTSQRLAREYDEAMSTHQNDRPGKR